MPGNKQSATRRLLRLLAYARPYSWVVVVAVVFSLLYASGLTGRVYLIKPLIDDIVIPDLNAKSIGGLLSGENPLTGPVAPEALEAQRAVMRERVDQNLYNIVLAALGIVFLMPLVRLVRDYAVEWVMIRMWADMNMDLGSKFLRLPLAHHVRGKRGDFLARIGSDTMVANRAQGLVFGEAIQHLFQILGALTWAFILCAPLALILLLVGPPVALVLRVFGSRIRRSSQRRQEQISEVLQRLVQILSGIKVIKAFGAEALEFDAYAGEIKRYFRRALKVVRNRVLSRSLVELSSQAQFVSVILVGIYALLSGWWGITLGTFAAFMGVSAMLYAPTKSLTKLYNSVQDALPASTRVFEILDSDEEVGNVADPVSIERISQGIRFSGVSFNYDREEVLKHIDLEISAGESLALVGPTGSGKTTLADLLLRFHDPTSGTVEIDGIDLRRLERESLRRLTAVVTQEPFLFDTSLLENIRYGRPEASFEEVVEAARAANANEFIEKLPDGLETQVGELGAQLSGGQRQRITVARAILRDPQLLIFDEATSALDAKSEQIVQDAIGNLMEGRTVLVIAHRLSTVQAADRIAVLEDGRITMTGTHDELMSRGGLYRELVDLQLAKPADGRT
ncbi:MAG: ABC transporter ATP-binding protein [bacterium]|nr:ABC transporter ATP-binding protein [bacterium]